MTRRRELKDGWEVRQIMDLSTHTWTSVAIGPDPVEESRRLAVFVKWGVFGGRAEPADLTVRSVSLVDAAKPVRLLLVAAPAGAVPAGAIRHLALADMVNVMRRGIAEIWHEWQRKHPGEKPRPVRVTCGKCGLPKQYREDLHEFVCPRCEGTDKLSDLLARSERALRAEHEGDR